MTESKRERIKEQVQQSLSPTEAISPSDVLRLSDMLDLAHNCFDEILNDFEMMSKTEILEKIIETIGLIDVLDQPE